MTGDANQMAVRGRRRKLPWPGSLGCLVVLIKTGLCEHCLLFMKPTLSSHTWTISELTELISKESQWQNRGSRGQTTVALEIRGKPTCVRFSGSFPGLLPWFGLHLTLRSSSFLFISFFFLIVSSALHLVPYSSLGHLPLGQDDIWILASHTTFKMI